MREEGKKKKKILKGPLGICGATKVIFMMQNTSQKIVVSKCRKKRDWGVLGTFWVSFWPPPPGCDFAFWKFVGVGVVLRILTAHNFRKPEGILNPPLLIFLPELSSEFAPEFQSDSVEWNETFEGNKKNQKGFFSFSETRHCRGIIIVDVSICKREGRV